MSDFGSIERYFEGIDRHHSRLREEFMRLAAEPCQETPKVGDRVLVASGLIGMGFPWVRKEAVVLEVADTACLVKFEDRINQGVTEWIHNVLITDVLGAQL